MENGARVSVTCNPGETLFQRTNVQTKSLDVASATGIANRWQVTVFPEGTHCTSGLLAITFRLLGHWQFAVRVAFGILWPLIPSTLMSASDLSKRVVQSNHGTCVINDPAITNCTTMAKNCDRSDCRSHRPYRFGSQSQESDGNRSGDKRLRQRYKGIRLHGRYPDPRCGFATAQGCDR